MTAGGGHAGASHLAPLTRGPKGDRGDTLEGDTIGEEEATTRRSAASATRCPLVRFEASKLEEFFGAEVESGRFRCPVPNHDGSAQVGTPPGDSSGELRVLCSCRGLWLSLGAVRASMSYGEDRTLPLGYGGLSNIEIATWNRRLAFETGTFRPVRVPVPRDLEPPHVRAAAEGFALLVGLRWADGPERPVPYSVRFATAWCGLGRHAAHLAIRELRERGYLLQDGRAGRTPLFRPGLPKLEAVT